MIRKRAVTGNLLYDFNTAAVCEVMVGDQWYRVTAREFRSFNGPRQLTQPDPTATMVQGNPNVPMVTTPYVGNVYVFMTNTCVDYTNSQLIVTNPDLPTPPPVTNSNRL